MVLRGHDMALLNRIVTSRMRGTASPCKTRYTYSISFYKQNNPDIYGHKFDGVNEMA